MPAEGVQLTPSSALLTHAELLRLAGLFVEAGVSKIRLTGGEPTVYPNLVGLCEGLTALPGLQTLAMTTNGIKLSRQLPDLKRAGGQPRGSLVPGFLSFPPPKYCTAPVFSAAQSRVQH